MADNTPDVEDVPEAPVSSGVPRTQAEWDAARAAKKKAAAKVVKTNAKKAAEAKKAALAKGVTLGDEDFNKRAAEVEKRANERAAAALEVQGKDGLRQPAEVQD